MIWREADEQALKTYDNILALNPRDATAWHERGDFLRKMARFQEAVESYDKALAINPKDIDAWVSRGLILLEEKDCYEEALDSFNQAVDIAPEENAWFWYYRGQALKYLGRLQEAAESYEEALEREDETLKFWEAKAEALDKLEAWLQTHRNEVEAKLDSLYTVEEVEAFLKAHPPSPNIDVQIYQELRVTEGLLHRFIRQKLEGAFGKDWWGRVPEKIQESCTRRQKENLKRQDKWDCTCLIDLKKILAKNWSLFEPDFQQLRGERKSKTKFLRDLSHLNEIRNLVMHVGGRVSNYDLEFARSMRTVIECFTGTE